MSHEGKKDNLHTDEEMLKKILIRRCGACDTDEYAADELELGEEFAEDNHGIGESDYFSTCEYKMISEDDDLVDFQGS